MKSMLLLFSHKLTTEQKKDAEVNQGVTDFIHLPLELQRKWSQVPTYETDLGTYAVDFLKWIESESEEGDLVLIQGDFGLSFLMVKHSINIGRIPVYATTERKSKEILSKGGTVEKTLVFEHCMFRRYSV